MLNIIIEETLLQGKPLQIERELQIQLANQILTMTGNNYQDTCEQMRQMADVFEILEEHINDDFITLKYNPMGCWYLVEENNATNEE